MKAWTEIKPGQKARDYALRLITIHPLRSADALQLAAALIWVNGNPQGYRFVCLDKKLRTAAQKEGFTILPNTLRS